MMYRRFIFVLFVLFSVSACSEARYGAHLAKQIPLPGDTPKSQGTFKVGSSYKIKGKRYYPKESYTLKETGVASWYGPGFHGKTTANGETFNKYELTAAHRTLQMPSLVRVTNLGNGKSLILRINDRGPFAHNRILDVSERAAELLGFKLDGTAKVRVEVLPEESMRLAQAAKAGRDTRGTEIALNRNRVPGAAPLPSHKPLSHASNQGVASAPNTQPTYKTASVQPVSSEPLPTRTTQNQNAPQQLAGVTNNIYVQAGAFSVEQNALALSERLSGMGNSRVYLSNLNGRPFYRVRLGPYTDLAQADATLNRLLSGGNPNAMIVTE